MPPGSHGTHAPVKNIQLAAATADLSQPPRQITNTS